MGISVFAFMFITLGLGSATAIAGWSEKEDLLERAVISIGVGLISIPPIGILLNLLRIPVSYISFAILASTMAILSVTYLLRQPGPRSGMKLLKNTALSASNLTVIFIFSISFLMYLKGSFSYPWLESQDPWSFASATKYISLNRTFSAPYIFSDVSQPYPQGYQIIMAILHQTNQSLNWTLKFFNSLFVALSLPFFYYLAKRLISNKGVAVMAFALLASMPAWLTHYIFALNLNMVFVPLFFYLLNKSADDPRWGYLAAIAFSSIWAVHYYTASVITIMVLLYYLTKSFCEGSFGRSLPKICLSGLSITVLLFWLPSYIALKRFPFNNSIASGGTDVLALRMKETFLHRPVRLSAVMLIFAVAAAYGIFRSRPALIKKLTSWRYLKPAIFIISILSAVGILLIPKKILYVTGTGSMNYDINSFFIFNNIGNLVQNPFGIGTVPMVLCLAGVSYSLLLVLNLFTEKHSDMAVLFVWVIFSFLGVMGNQLSIAMMPFRIWPFFAFSCALFGAYAFNEIAGRLKLNNIARNAIVAALILLAVPFWYHNKLSLNTNVWKEGYLNVLDSQKLYAWSKDGLPKNSKVYSYSIDQFVPIAFDMVSMPWDRDVYDYASKDLETSLEKDRDFFKKKGYDYAVIDGSGALYKYMYKYKDLPDKMREAILFRNIKLMVAKKDKMKSDTAHFKIIKEGKSGTVFKVL